MQKQPSDSRRRAAPSTRSVTCVLLRIPSTCTSSTRLISSSSPSAPERVSRWNPSPRNSSCALGWMFSRSRTLMRSLGNDVAAAVVTARQITRPSADRQRGGSREPGGGRSVVQTVPVTEPKTLRVATLNIWNRFGPWDERLAAIRAGVRALSPDLLGLQEVVRLAPGDGDGLDQTSAIGDGFGYHAAYSRAHDEKWFGNALLS